MPFHWPFWEGEDVLMQGGKDYKVATGRDRLQHRQWTHKDKFCERPVSVDRGSSSYKSPSQKITCMDSYKSVPSS